MAFLDEVGLIVAPALVGGEILLWPVSSGSYWVAQDSAETGALYFQPSTSDTGLFSLTTSTGPLRGYSTGGGMLTAFTTAGEPVAWSMYLSHMPDSTVIPDRGVALINTAGGGENAQLDIEPRGLQVLVRGAGINQVSTAYEEAMDLAVTVRDALHEYSGISPTVTHYPGIWCENGPFFIGFDAGWRPLFSANFRCWRARD